MEATVEHVDVGKGAGYYKICLKIGNYELTTTADCENLHSLEKSQEIAENINKKIKEDRDKAIAYAIELRRESHKYDPYFRG
jgi:hypothetical protein